MIQLKRIYEPASEADGYRILVERLWPRGMTKETARLDLWLKEVAPSPELRKWFAHDPAKWTEFIERYRLELDQNRVVVDELKRITEQHDVVTFVYAASDTERNSARLLKDYIEESAS